uniref:Uncharacterized protein n=1 Tax=Anopheles atroparvus TaxID=41427 RepID=A0A182IM36_ANOAO
VQVLGHLPQNRVRAAVVSISAVHPAVRRHARVRMVCARPDLRLQHNALLRGHPPGQEQGAEAYPLLDESRLLYDLHHRNVLEVDRAGVYQVFLQLLDDPGLCDRIRVCVFAADRGERKLEGTTLAKNAPSAQAPARDLPLAGHENSSECIDVCDTVHLQCTPSMSRLLADLLDHGCAVFWREVLQVRRRRW